MKLTPRMPCINVVLILISAWLMASCGGGGGGYGGGSTPAPVLISGTVASGTALTGSVSVYDSSASTQPRLQNTTIGAAGAYSVNVAGFTAPFLLQATGQVGGQGSTVTLYAVATGAGTVNLTPITTLMVLNMAAGNVQTFMTGSVGGLPGLTAADLNTQNTNMDNLLSAVLPAVVLSATYDFRTVSFTVGGKGYDQLLDNVGVNPASPAAVTVTNTTAPATPVTINTINGSPNGTLDVTNGPTVLPVGTLANISVPAVTGLTQAAATTAITGAGLVLGTVTMASSTTVASGSVISQSPAATTSVAPNSAVNLTVSTGAAQVAVPDVVGMTQAAATTSITGAGLVLGSVTMASSATIPSGSVISQSPVPATMVAPASAVNLTVSTGPAASFAYVSNVGDGTISAYSINSTTGALSALTSSPVTVPGAGTNGLAEIKVDPSGKFLYVANTNLTNNVLTSDVYAYAINSDGSLTAVPGSPFPGGVGAQSLAFDATGTHLYVANVFSNNGVGQGTISAYALNASTGALTQLTNSPYTIGTNTSPQQIVSAGNYLYVVDENNNGVEVFAIASGTGALTQNVPGAPFATDLGPYSLAADPSGSVLYTKNAGPVPQGQFTGPGTVSAFTINSTTGVLTPVAGNPLQIPSASYIAIDPLGKFLFLTESIFSSLVNGGVSVYPINKTTGVLGPIVAGSPFATGGNNSFWVSIDPTGTFVYVSNDQSANISEFTLNSTTGVLTPIAGSPVAAGNLPDYIAIK